MLIYGVSRLEHSALLCFLEKQTLPDTGLFPGGTCPILMDPWTLVEGKKESSNVCQKLCFLYRITVHQLSQFN